MLITTEGTVISLREQGDNDRIIKVLSPEMGLIEITAKGAKKQNSSNNSATQLFACGKYCFNERNGRYYLNSSEPARIFYGLRLDIQVLSLASYFAEIISCVVTEKQSARDVYRLFMNCLYMLSEKKADCRFIKFIFEMRITADLGMMPDLFGCHKCYRSEDVELNFVVDRGIFVCTNHMDLQGVKFTPYLFLVSYGEFEAIRFVCLSEIDKIFNFKLSESALEKLGKISELYARVQLDKNFKTLNFYKEIESQVQSDS